MAVYRAPGRVNLLGDHTDYNAGFVLPMAIQLETIVVATPRPRRELLLASDRAAGRVVIDLEQPLHPRHDWTDYVAGVAHVLREEGHTIDGAELSIASTVPLGAGLASSAALEVAAALALLRGIVCDRRALAEWCQRAENTFVGARCGIMDQYIACLGHAGHALHIDCRSAESRPIRMPAAAAVIVCNTMVRHHNATGEYNLRRQQCDDAVRVLSGTRPGIRTLRDVSMDELTAQHHLLSPAQMRRARHVISENGRVAQAVDALERQDLSGFGELMHDSHRSLRDDFEVSAPELDLLVQLALAERGVFGSRMTGGGFGGCTVTLTAASETASIVSAIRRGYARDTGTTPEIWVCVPSSGASAVAS
jgi:galactokinase